MEVDQALVAFHKFKGKCTNCGKFGQKSTECQSKIGNSKEEGAESGKSRSKKGTDKSKIKCFLCSKMGHNKLKCPKTKSNKGTSKQLEKEDTVLIVWEEGLEPCNNIWIADLATLTHIVNSKVGLYETNSIASQSRSEMVSWSM